MGRKSTRASSPSGVHQEKLSESGLTDQDADELGIEYLSGRNGIHEIFEGRVGLKLNYFDLDGKPMTDWPGAGQFYRVRFLDPDSRSSFAAAAGAKPKKAQKYGQEPDTLACAYYPRLIDWRAVAEDPGYDIVITEGELKAACACKMGFATIGLGGVYCFKSSKHGISFIPSLKPINWLRRKVYIVYDTDAEFNPDISLAMNALAEELQRLGAFPYSVSLPRVLGPDNKVGLDDFLMHHPTAPTMFVDLLKGAEPLGMTGPLFDLNEKYVYVRNPGMIVARKSGYRMSCAAFKDHAESAKRVMSRELLSNGEYRVVETSGPSKWLSWPIRSEVDAMTYAPGQERIVMNASGTYYNTWPGWGVKPVKGSVKPFLDLLSLIFRGSKAEMDWFLKWCAYPIQFPGTKLYTSCVIWGRQHGTGKSLVGYTLGRIYGSNFTEITGSSLHANHNEWAENKQLVLGDDVTGTNKRSDNDTLKKMITQVLLRINPKYVPSYTVPDVINYYFTSNHPDAFFLEDDDRRFFIWEVTTPTLDEAGFAAYLDWLNNSDGPAKLMHYFQTMDLKSFNPAGRAMWTDAKGRMISDVQSDLGTWVRRLQQDPDSVLKIGQTVVKRDLFMNSELLTMYDPQSRTGTTANGLGREMRRAGIPQVCDGKQLRGPAGLNRYYVVRNHAKWAKATVEEATLYLSKQAADKRKPPLLK